MVGLVIFWKIVSVTCSTHDMFVGPTYGLQRHWIISNFSWATQFKLVCTTMAIHNFIRRSEFRDIAFDSYDRFANYVPNEEEGSSSQQARHGNDIVCDDNEMEVRRHNICMSICRRN